MDEKNQTAVSELSSLFRMLQVIPEADNVSKIYLMLLAFCTSWNTIGFRRAFLLLVDSRNRLVKGQLGAQRIPFPEKPEGLSFEALAKRAFDNYEQIEASDLTLKARTFAVPLDWHRSATVKAIATEHPVLADEQMSEFNTDPFLDFFGARRYIALPIKIRGSVTGVLAADNGASDDPITVDDISIVFSLVQHAALSVERLIDSSDNKRKLRIMRKLQDILRAADTPTKLNEGVNLALSMICRAVGGSGCFLKDSVRKKTTHIKTVDEYTVDADAADTSIGECFDDVLDRAAGTVRPVQGTSAHALMNDVAAERIRYFLACPLNAAGDCHGALAVYVEKDESNRKRTRFSVKDRTFLELCSGAIAEKLDSVRKMEKIKRCEDMLEEFRSNLVREKRSARLGERALDHYNDLTAEVSKLREIVFSKARYESRVARAKEVFDEVAQRTDEWREELASLELTLRMTDLFGLVERVASAWKTKMEKAGVEVGIRIPSRRPSLLMNADKISLAFENILSTLTSCVTDDDKVMIECSATDDRAMVCIADTGTGLPGNLLSRLFMPFSEIDRNDEFKSAMSLAGDILHQHAGEITIRSSSSWKTVLVVAFPIVSNKDRRRRRQDRRNRPRDRRKTVASR